ncbi:MAG TPA: PLP-dependent aminotransferase family protein [Vicinamibacterales bacterium]|nr:PLP-dependent aminotransferase family protein [Vicinamibacterales bacterium]
MPRRASDGSIVLPPRRGQRAAQWLYAALRAAILDGQLRAGARVPASRDLARQYGVARGTVVSAFELLASEGYLRATRGSGTYVSAVLPDQLLSVAGAIRASRSRKLERRRHLTPYARRLRIIPPLKAGPTRAFRANQPALDLFPMSLWAQVAARRLRRASTRMLLSCDPMGYSPLRETVAGYLRISRGVRCTADQIAIVSGVQEVLDLAGRLFIVPGDSVCVENPGYVGAVAVFEAAGASIAPMGLDNEGMVVPPQRLTNPRLVYVTPGHQFPLGITMSLPRRLQLIDWARRAGALILEDDYDSEFRFSGRPVPAMQGLDRHGLVLFAGSFSKVLFPSLRLGYVVIPENLVSVVSAVRSMTMRHAPVIEQAILCDFIEEGHFGRHIRRMREVYAERLAVLMESVAATLGGALELSSVEAGLQTVGWLGDGQNAELLATAAAQRAVEVTPLSRYYFRGRAARQGLVMGFAAADKSEIRRGVRELAAAIAVYSE